MRKTVRGVQSCPHCGQKIRFNESNPAYLKKQGHIKPEKKAVTRRIIKCPYKNCEKPISVKVTPRRIKLSKRVPHVERVLLEMLS